MSLSVILSQLIKRSRLNPGKIYTERLDGGLSVAFRTKYDRTIMQLSRLKPTEPSYLELTVCLKALNVTDPENYQSEMLQDASNYYLQVDVSSQGS